MDAFFIMNELNFLLSSYIAFERIEISLLFGIIIGLTGGFTTALYYREKRIITQWVSIVGVIAGWVICSIVEMIIGILIFYDRPIVIVSFNRSTFWILVILGAIIWMLGWLLTGVMLKIEKAITSWKSVIWVAFGWALCSAISKVILFSIGWDVELSRFYAIGPPETMTPFWSVIFVGALTSVIWGIIGWIISFSQINKKLKVTTMSSKTDLSCS